MENSVSLVGKNNRIDIIFSTIGYELTCQFVDGAKNVFSLQDGLGYVKIKESKGLYQIPDKAEEYWKKGEYSKAQELYEKHFSSLSKAQKKRLEYIRKTHKKRARWGEE